MAAAPAAAAGAVAAAAASTAGGGAVRQWLRDRGVRWVLGGWALFTAENVIMSEYRNEIKRSYGGAGGPGAYQNMYSLLSATCLASTFIGYWRFARFGVAVQPPSMAAKAGAVALRAAGLVTLGQLAPPINFGAAPIALGLSAPPPDLPPAVRGAMGCPFDFNAQRNQGEVYGVVRISRRPELFGLMAVGLGGALLATTATQVCFFGVGPVLSFTALAFHSDSVQRREGEISATKEAQTSLLPFLALLDGRQSWLALYEEIVPANAGAGAGLALLAVLRPSWMRWVK